MLASASRSAPLYFRSLTGELAFVPRVEATSGLGHDQRRTLPADVLVPDLVLGAKLAAFDITVTA